MREARFIVAGFVAEALLPAWGAPAEKGKELFARRRSGCHALDLNKEGPRLRGVYKRKTAGLAEFGYSEALKKLNVHRDDRTPDRGLTDPEAMAPNTDVAFHVGTAEERSALIAYLKSLSQ